MQFTDRRTRTLRFSSFCGRLASDLGIVGSILFQPTVSTAKDVLPHPTYANTFYLFLNDGYRGSPEGTTPYDEGWPEGGLTMEYQLLKLEEILSRIGPDGPYLRLGVAEALRPFDVVDPDDDWNYIGSVGLTDSTGSAEDSDCAEIKGGVDPYFNSVIIKSWALADMPGMLFVHSLTRQHWQELTDSLAVPGNLVAYLEMQPETVQRFDDGKICIADNGDDVHTPSDYVELPEFNGNEIHGTELTLSRLLPAEWRIGYMKRNIQAGMEHVLEINREYPGLIVAVSIDSEFDMNFTRCFQGECEQFADFNQFALAEWRQWLSHTGIYGSGGDYADQGADPWFPTLELFNQATGSSFLSWEDVDPRSPDAGDTLWDLYLDGGDMDGEYSPENAPGSGFKQGWCEVMIEHRCEDAVAWLAEVAGAEDWSADRIFTHQVPGGFVDEALNEEALPYWGYEHRLCTLAATDVTQGRPGITGFRESTLNYDLIQAVHGELSPDGAWANLEFNPIKAAGLFPQYENDYDLWLDCYKTAWEEGAHMLSPFRWWVPPETATSWANIRPNFHPEDDPTIDFEARLDATHDFVSNDTHRFRPWSPQGGSLNEVADYLPPTPTLARFEYNSAKDQAYLSIDPIIFADCARLMWYDTSQHELWPELTNVFGWPEFTEGEFLVHRDTVPNFAPSSSNLLGHVNIPQFSYVDTTVPLLAPVFYAVTAQDNQGDTSLEPVWAWIAPEIAFPYGDSLTVEMSENSHMDTSMIVANTGERPLVIDEVLSDSPWLVVTGLPRILQPNTEGPIGLRFLSDGLAPGVYVGSLLILSNDPFENDAVVAVTLLLALQGLPATPTPGDLMLFPQPNEGHIRMSWPCGEPGVAVTVALLDVGGRLVHLQRGVSDDDGTLHLQLNLSEELSSGTYVVRVSSERRTTQREVVLLR